MNKAHPKLVARSGSETEEAGLKFKGNYLYSFLMLL
jgi:hypothetical protein